MDALPLNLVGWIGVMAVVWWRTGRLEKEQDRQRERLHNLETIATALLVNSGIELPAGLLRRVGGT